MLGGWLRYTVEGRSYGFGDEQRPGAEYRDLDRDRRRGRSRHRHRSFAPKKEPVGSGASNYESSRRPFRRSGGRHEQYRGTREEDLRRRLQGRRRGRRTLVARPKACKSIIEDRGADEHRLPRTSLISRMTTPVLTCSAPTYFLSVFPALAIAQSSVEFT